MPENGVATEGSSSSRLNPFARRNQYSSQSILLYKITTTITYLLLLITAIYYTFRSPHEGHKPHGKIWDFNLNTAFQQSAIMTSIYWIIVFALQLVYAWTLYSSDEEAVAAAANIGAHYVANNLLLFGFIHLWTRSHFWLAELLIVINFFNLSSAYFRHPKTPKLIHIGTVSGPLAWNFVALYWVGAVASHAHSLPARIVANIFVWGILVYGGFFLVAYKDYTMGFALSVLAFSTGVAQFLHVHLLQWIFSFIIGALLFLASVPIALGKDPFPRGQVVDEENERAPLLDPAA